MTTIRRGNLEIVFDAEEWICVRYCYAQCGPGSVLTKGGDLDAEGVREVRSMIERARTKLLDLQLDESISDGPSRASKELFELIRTRWKLPYLVNLEGGRGPMVFRAKKCVGRLEETLQMVPRFRDVPVFMRAWNKLETLFDGGETTPTARVDLDS